MKTNLTVNDILARIDDLETNIICRTAEHYVINNLISILSSLSDRDYNPVTDKEDTPNFYVELEDEVTTAVIDDLKFLNLEFLKENNLLTCDVYELCSSVLYNVLEEIHGDYIHSIDDSIIEDDDTINDLINTKE